MEDQYNNNERQNYDSGSTGQSSSSTGSGSSVTGTAARMKEQADGLQRVIADLENFTPPFFGSR